jgi:hypothetical protein
MRKIGFVAVHDTFIKPDLTKGIMTVCNEARHNILSIQAAMPVSPKDAASQGGSEEFTKRRVAQKVWQMTYHGDFNLPVQHILASNDVGGA